MYVGVSYVVPDALCGEVHGEGVRAFFEMGIGVGAVVAAAAYCSAD